MIEEFLLPNRLLNAQFTRNPFARPLFPSLDESLETHGILFSEAKEMDVVPHNHISPDSPSVPDARVRPFVDQNFCDVRRRENLPPLKGAGRNEIDWPFQPNVFETRQMLVHRLTGITDAGYNFNINRAAWAA